MGLRRAAAGGDVLVLARGQLRGFLDPDDVIFQAQIGIDVLFALVMAELNARTVGEHEQAARGVKLMGQPGEEALAQVFKVFEVGFPDFAEEKALEAGHALAIVVAHLRKEPVGFAAAARSAVADSLGTVRLITEPGRRAGGKLPGLKDDAGLGKVEELGLGTTLLQAELKKLLQFDLHGGSQGRSEVHGELRVS